MATITGKRFQMTDGAASPVNLFPYTVSEAVYGLNNAISNAISSALSTISLSTYAGTSAIGSSVQPVYYNGTALVATDLSTTYAPYNAAGYLPLTGGTLSGQLTLKDHILRFQSGSTERYIGYYSDIDDLSWYTGSAWTKVWHSGNSNNTDAAWAASSLTFPNTGTIQWEDIPGTTDGAPYITRESNSYSDTTRGDMTFSAGRWTSYDDVTAFKFVTSGAAYAMCIKNNGNVGIGTAWPGTKLDISGGNLRIGPRGAEYLEISSSDTNVYYNAYDSDGWCSHNFQTNGTTFVCFTGYNQSVGIGTTSPTQKLHVDGNILSTGDQVISSDRTLKTNLQDVTYSVSDIAKCRAVTFDWKDGHGHSAGSIAQDWKPLIPELVHGEEGGMTLAYGQIALVNSILEAREIERLKERVAELENQLKMRS